MNSEAWEDGSWETDVWLDGSWIQATAGTFDAVTPNSAHLVRLFFRQMVAR